MFNLLSRKPVHQVLQLIRRQPTEYVSKVGAFKLCDDVTLFFNWQRRKHLDRFLWVHSVHDLRHPVCVQLLDCVNRLFRRQVATDELFEVFIEKCFDVSSGDSGQFRDDLVRMLIAQRFHEFRCAFAVEKHECVGDF